MDNPLENELILSTLFSHASLKELAKCRLMCKKWNYAANPYVRRKARIEFFGYTLKNLREFLSVVSTTKDFPFAKFGLQIWDKDTFSSRFPSIPEDSENFFAICGPHIKEFRLGFNDFLETVCKSEFRKWFLSSVPNLQTLELSGLSFRTVLAQSIFEDGAETQIFPNLKNLFISDSFGESPDVEIGVRYTRGVLHDLFTMCPYLETLSVSVAGDLPSSLISSAMTALDRLSTSYLRKISLHCIIHEEDLNQILACNFQLYELELDILDPNVHTTTLEKILKSQKDTLTKLVLGEQLSPSQLPPTEILHLQIPCMEKLINLTIARPYASRKLIFLPKVYQNNFPSLTSLDLKNVQINYEDFFPEDFGVNETLTTLRMPPNFVNVNLMEIVFKNFPNLKSLSMASPSDEVVKIIWEQGSRLAKLELTDLTFLEADSVFTGIPTKICEWIQEEKAYSRLNENFFQVVGRKKSLRDMKNLRHLVIEFRSMPEVLENVTDVMCYLTLGQLNELSKLSIRGAQISDECKRWISENEPQIFNLEISFTR